MKRIKKIRSSIFIVIVLVIIFIIKSSGSDSDDEQPPLGYVTNHDHVLVIVLTTEESILTRGIASWDTWVKHNKHVVFVCNCENVKRTQLLIQNRVDVPDELRKYEKVSQFTILSVNMEESYKNMGVKLFQSIHHAYTQYSNQVQWYYIVDDDTYVFTHNLIKFIRTHDTSLAKMYGFKFYSPPHFRLPIRDVYLSGGAGSLFTSEAMKRLSNAISRGECDRYLDSYGDVATGRCAHSLGIKIGNSNDKHNRPRFHPDSVKAHFYGPLPEPYVKSGEHNGKIGKECCSLETISFHYVDSEEKYNIYSTTDYLKKLLS